MLIHNFTVGADPEIFLKEKGKAISAHGLIEGTKESPKKTPRGAVQVDGMALEFNIDPTSLVDFESFNMNIVRTMADLKEMVKGKTFNLSPTQEFDKEYLEAQPDSAKELGCDPDYNAYTGEMNTRPDGEVNFRTAAGHVHLGWGNDIPVDNPDHFEICRNMVKFFDKFVGLFMTIIDRDPKRRELYGKAGAFRPKSYGVEYRTPSNVWLKNKEYRELFHLCVNISVEEAIRKQGVFKDDENDFEKIINEGDFYSAYMFLKYTRTYCASWYKLEKKLEKMVQKDFPELLEKVNG